MTDISEIFKKRRPPPLNNLESPESVAPEPQADLPGPDDPCVQQMVAVAFPGRYTVDELVSNKAMPQTFKLDTPRGELYWTKSRAAAAKLVAAGKVVFTPLEVERMVLAIQKDKLQRAERLERGENEGEPAISQALTDRIYDMKKLFPGCKLDEILIENDK